MRERGEISLSLSFFEDNFPFPLENTMDLSAPSNIQKIGKGITMGKFTRRCRFEKEGIEKVSLL